MSFLDYSIKGRGRAMKTAVLDTAVRAAAERDGTYLTVRTPTVVSSGSRYGGNLS